MAIHPDQNLLVTGGRDSTARVWDLRTRAEVMTLGGHGDTVWTVKMQADEP